MNIRNFAIIAHVDHGKSTLADRLLELTGVVSPGKHNDQMLDRNPISRERGITIKLAPVRMEYRIKNQESSIMDKSNLIHNSEFIILNLIDTPGHVDFSYEVDRTLACVEGVLLLVDATQGIQAQTIANAYKAIMKNLVIIPVVNKIDLASARLDQTKKQLTDLLGINEEEIYAISAKTGQGVPELLDIIINKVPKSLSHDLSADNVFQALIFDSYYDQHRGVIAFIRVFKGELKKGMKMRLFQSNARFEVIEVGYFSPDLIPSAALTAGEIGYVVTNLKIIQDVRVGDTLVLEKSTSTALPGYKKINPMVYASMFPTDTADYPNLHKALEKLHLNDASLQYSIIHSKALGAGFRVGFLGLLHADVIRERLEREFNLNLVLTPPQVEYKIEGHDFFEPYVKTLIVTPQEYLGPIMQLCEKYRAKFVTMDNKNQVTLSYEMPMSELISDFFDNLKSVSSGYSSLDWDFSHYEKVEADRLSILLNSEPIEEFSEVVVKERSFEKAQYLVSRLKDSIPRQQYEVKIQAQYKGKIIASSRITPFRKNVLVKSGKVLGSGDVGRKKKLLERQKEGKKRMKMVGRIEIPKETFMKLFKK
ncbi:MAG: Elongation factor 4 [Candidatus Roizmanbacteria bacterium GW2011_GWA2_36_23]|uniref:Elongation factor 4 n=1 Tax=Candidatus Roizmanbacteria bacterium GW2011_GWA2_36_23 TaxID=1618480 RepID=A0A0G0EKX2_9BACT|nr:MAG: Elongation factor 4 [Candidatus Roizmanbacteria bacterium GW2011_GWA2_36_23]